MVSLPPDLPAGQRQAVETLLAECGHARAWRRPRGERTRLLCGRCGRPGQRFQDYVRRDGTTVPMHPSCRRRQFRADRRRG